VGLNRTTALIDKIVASVSNILNNIAMVVLFIMMSLTAVDVFFRYFFNRPIAGSYELTEFMMVILVSFGLARCAVERGHVNVDLIITRFSKKTQTIITGITSLLSLALSVLITWQSFIHIEDIFQSKLKTPVLLIPVYPFVAFVGIGFACLCFVFLVDVYKFLSGGKY